MDHSKNLPFPLVYFFQCMIMLITPERACSHKTNNGPFCRQVFQKLTKSCPKYYDSFDQSFCACQLSCMKYSIKIQLNFKFTEFISLRKNGEKRKVEHINSYITPFFKIAAFKSLLLKVVLQAVELLGALSFSHTASAFWFNFCLITL